MVSVLWILELTFDRLKTKIICKKIGSKGNKWCYLYVSRFYSDWVVSMSKDIADDGIRSIAHLLYKDKSLMEQHKVYI